MNRRIFARLLAMGAGAVGMAQTAVEAAPPVKPRANSNTTPAAKSAAAGSPPPQAVNVADFQLLAKAKLPKTTFDYITSGSGDEWTLRENLAAFGRIRVLPPLLAGVSAADLSTTVLGQQIALPIMFAPVAAQRMYHPQGALAAARAAAAAGTVMGVSSSAMNSLEEVAAASAGPKWYQLYMPKDRGVARRLVERAEKAGYQALIVTVDLGERKDSDRRNRFAVPHEMLAKHLRDNGFDGLDRMSYDELLAFNRQAWDLGLSWDLLPWLRSITKLPLVLKGVLRSDDAKKAVEAGVKGIVVSNHGGRRLDGMPASIDMLPGVVEAVGGLAEIFLDSGIRRGTDVFKALALGARAVLVGRPYAWALAADGEAGVHTVIELLKEELTNAMVSSGCAKLSDVNKSLLM